MTADLKVCFTVPIYLDGSMTPPKPVKEYYYFSFYDFYELWLFSLIFAGISEKSE